MLAHELHVTGVPEQLDELAAAAVPEAFVTAHDAVLTQAGLRPGELLVVNGANGGVGTRGRADRRGGRCPRARDRAGGRSCARRSLRSEQR